MNPKIEEIVRGYGLYDAPEEEIERFAMAIIIECILQCHKIEDDGAPDAVRCILAIKDHFGLPRSSDES